MTSEPTDQRLSSMGDTTSDMESRAAGPKSSGDARTLAFDGLVLSRILGSGGQGVVYEAEQVGTGRRVAVKMLRSGTNSSDIERARFQREVQLAASLDHENIVQVLGSGYFEGVPYFIMELVDGVPLLKHVRTNCTTLRERLELFRFVCDAVAHAHARTIVHRDLKADNVLVDSSNRPKLLDFGTARALPDRALTATGKFIGTLYHAAPEQLSAPNTVDTRSDVHALGLILYQLLTGTHPFASAATTAALVNAIQNHVPPRASSTTDRISSELSVIAERCLQKDPKMRYATAEALKDDVDRYLDGRPVLARGTSTTYLAWKLIRRRPGRSLMAVGLLALIGTLTAMTLQRGFAAARQRDRAIAAEALAASEANNAREIARQALGVFDSASGFLGDKASSMDAVYRRVTQESAALNPELTDLLARQRLIVASYYTASGAHARSRDLLSKVIRSRLETATPDESVLADAYADLANVWRLQNRLTQSRLAESRSLRLRSQSFQCRWEPLALNHARLALISHQQGDRESAHEHEEFALGLIPILDTSEARADSLEALAELASREGRICDAIGHLSSELRDRQSLHGPGALATARCSSRLGEALVETGDFIEAERRLRRSLGIQQHGLPWGSARQAPTLMALGRACELQGRRYEAMVHVERALHLLEVERGPDDPSVADAIRMLTSLYRSNGRHSAATEMESRLERLERVLSRVSNDRMTDRQPEEMIARDNLIILGLHEGDQPAPDRIGPSVMGRPEDRSAWSARRVTPMREGRQSHQATRLHDGRVLVTGGASVSTSAPRSSAEIFDPETRTWSSTGNMNVPRHAHVALRLRSGEVLVGGGFRSHHVVPTAEIEVWHPTTEQFQVVGQLAEPRGEGLALMELGDGRVLILGGDSGDGYGTATASIEVFDPQTGLTTSLGQLALSRHGFLACRLRSGLLLAAGGSSRCCADPASRLRQATYEILDPAAQVQGEITDLPGFLLERVQSQALPSDGRRGDGCLVRTTVGQVAAFEDGAWRLHAPPGLAPLRTTGVFAWLSETRVFIPHETGAEVLDTTSGIWATVEGLPHNRNPSVTVLDDECVLVTGGSTDAIQASSEAWMACEQPSDSSSLR